MKLKLRANNAREFATALNILWGEAACNNRGWRNNYIVVPTPGDTYNVLIDDCVSNRATVVDRFGLMTSVSGTTDAMYDQIVSMGA